MGESARYSVVLFVITISFSAARRTFLMYAEVVVCVDGEFLFSSSGNELT
jgi:hypothetical protein